MNMSDSEKRERPQADKFRAMAAHLAAQAVRHPGQGKKFLGSTRTFHTEEVAGGVARAQQRLASLYIGDQRPERRDPGAVEAALARAQAKRDRKNARRRELTYCNLCETGWGMSHTCIDVEPGKRRAGCEDPKYGCHGAWRAAARRAWRNFNESVAKNSSEGGGPRARLTFRQFMETVARDFAPEDVG